MSTLELYNRIRITYGARGCYISELAQELGISKKQARLLTQAMGFHRTKRCSKPQYSTFAANKFVLQIQPKIK